VRGLVLVGPHEIVHRDDLPDPSVQAPTDVVVAVHRSGLCGSDLHPYEGREGVRSGVIPGHEAVGEVIAVGREVASFAVGDRVLVPFSSSCGTCPPCREALSARCDHGQLFGYGSPDDPQAPALDGAQAELLRVPLADGTLVHLPEAIDDATGVLLTDNAPTGWVAAARAEIGAGDAVAVVGLGSVGLCSLSAAIALGAGAVLAVDPVEGRRQQALHLGAAVAVAPEHAAAAAAELTSGRGVAASIDATGADAGQALAFHLLRAGGRLSIIAVQTAERFAFTPIDAYDRNVSVRAGRAPVRSVLEHLLPRIEAGAWRVPTELLLSHPAVPLRDGAAIYARFAAREPGLIKAAFAP
jgi:alcohol dehydrogenase